MSKTSDLTAEKVVTEVRSGYEYPIHSPNTTREGRLPTNQAPALSQSGPFSLVTMARMAGDYDYRAIYGNDDDDALFNDDSFLEAVANVEAQHLGRMTNVLSYNGPKISGSDTYGDGGPGVNNSIAGGKRSAPWDGQNNNNNGHTASGHQQVQHLSRGDNNSSFWSNAEEEQRKRLRTENDMRSNWPTDHQSGQVQEERSGSVRDSQQSKGEYMAALRGSNSELWQASGGARGIWSSSTAAAALPNRGGGTSGGEFKGGSGNCFKCGMEGHWSKDCTGGGGGVFNSPTKRAGGGGGEGQGGPPNVPERLCPCGAGACAVRTANTEKNLGRSFYRCPLRQDEGQCNFFEWCDAVGQSGPTDRASNFQPGLSEQPLLKCICGGGPCLVLTAKTEKNMGRQFYKCPLPQSCSFFQWCDEAAGRDAGRQISMTPPKTTNFSGQAASPFSASSGSTGCYKCGQEGHWSKDCPNSGGSFGAQSQSYSTGGGPMTPTKATNFPGPAASPFSASSGSAGCYKCGQEGHWSKDCPTSGGSFGTQSQSYNSTGGGPTESRNTGSCYKCGGPGHWSTSCPNSPVGQNVSKPVGGGGTSSGGSCYKCGDPGHWANRCPAAQGGQRY